MIERVFSFADPSFDVSRETIGRMEAFVDLLLKWNKAVNLVSDTTTVDIWARHIHDSAQIFAFGRNARSWADLGTGGGCPGIVVAILASQFSSEMKVTLIEADQRKSAFLRQTILSLGLTSIVITDRIESLEPLNADVISARALAPLYKLCRLAKRHLSQNGMAIFLKGKSSSLEIVEAQKTWDFSLESYPSVTDPLSSVLILKEIRNV